MDFFKCQIRETKKVRKGETRRIEVYPEFQVLRSEDLMCRSKNFYAVWDEARGFWSTAEYDVQRLVDEELYSYAKQLAMDEDVDVTVASMRGMGSGSWTNFKKYLQSLPDNFHELDKKLIFANTQTTKKDYATRTLPYPLEKGEPKAWDRIVGTLYSPVERMKIEWAIGSIVAGESGSLQKFIVLYGESGTGKSTILNIIQKLFQGYFITFESKALGSQNNTFATEAFRTNPLVAIEHDGDLSRIEDNTKLNSLVAHEEMLMNEKFKSSYTSRSQAFIFMGTNKPVKITDAKSGIIRRLIDVHPCGGHIPSEEYWQLMAQVEFELGAIAFHCLTLYNKMTKNYYSGYKPLEMILQTDVFYNFVESYYYDFVKEDKITLNRAWDLYKEYCEDALIEHRLPRHKFREELRNYFREFIDHTKLDGVFVRSLYSGFITDKFRSIQEEATVTAATIFLGKTESLLDKEWANCPAQYGNRTTANLPEKKWMHVETHLSDIDTKQLHYVQPPEGHIVIDFDLRDDTGSKSKELNLREASKWPPTYAEFSKSEAGIHLHYIYQGDTHKLSGIYSEGIEVKTFHGDASLRRQLSYCNDLPIAQLNSGLPLKGDKVLNEEAVKTEKGLRTLILKNLKKEYMHFTRPSVDFIKKILDDAYASGLKYDLSSMEPSVLLFASQSTNQAEYCVEQVAKMKFKSEDPEPVVNSHDKYEDDRIVFFDVETFPNLFYVSWKYKDVDMPCVRMFNPTPAEIEGLLKMKLVGFNNRRYDNHMLYGAYLGYSNQQLFMLSERIIKNDRSGFFREAYDISYTDVYDFSSIKQSLKAFQIQLKIHHQEFHHPWDQPVPEDKWEEVAKYCDNDVISLEAVFADRKQDFIAREILADLTGLTVNASTQTLMARLLFENDQKPQEKFNYVDLSEMFPGYKFDAGKSSYRGEDPGEGGYVYAEPGIYKDVALLDVASMHPSSIINMNMFGPYTKRYQGLLQARLAIKHKEYDKAKELLSGKLAKYLENPDDAKALAYALKIALNIVYGLTSASFDNKFRDPRNKDNIVAKRGALFMIDLKHAVQEKGFTVAHIKTDSIKIPGATKEIIDFVFEFGKKYGYTFEHETTYSKLCLVNNAVYIAKDKDGWHATGAEFAHPYVYKSLFSQEEIEFDDLCETKSVSSPAAIYLDMNESLGSTEEYEKELEKRLTNQKTNPKFQYMSNEDLKALVEKGHNYIFVGKIGRFCPVEPGAGGGIMLRGKEGKYTAVTGTKSYRWLEAETIQSLNLYDYIDTTYHEGLVKDAIDHISEFGDCKEFISSK